MSLDWLQAAGIRAIKTFAQTLAAGITIGASFSATNWTQVLSVAGVAFIYSLVTSLTGLPELKSSGTLKINTTDPNKDIYSLELTDALESLNDMKSVTFKVVK